MAKKLLTIWHPHPVEMCERERLCYVNIIYINVASRNLSRTIHIFQLKVTSSWNVCKSVFFLLVVRNKNLTWKHYSQHWLGGRIGPLNTSLINHGEIIDIFCQLIFCEVIYDWFWTVLCEEVFLFFVCVICLLLFKLVKGSMTLIPRSLFNICGTLSSSEIFTLIHELWRIECCIVTSMNVKC